MAGEVIPTGSPEVMDQATQQQADSQTDQQLLNRTPVAGPVNPATEQLPGQAPAPVAGQQQATPMPAGALSSPNDFQSQVNANFPSNGPSSTAGGMTNPEPTNEPVAPHRAFASKVLGVLSDMLGGYTHGNPTYKYDENGNLVKTPGEQLSTGKMIMKGVGAALGGLGASANVHGPGAAWRSLGAGFEGEQAKSIAMDERAREQASTEFKAREIAARDKASILHLQAETASVGWTMQRSQLEVDEKSLENNVALKGLLEAGGGQDLGTFKTWQEFLQKVPKQQQDQMIADAHQGIIRAAYETEGGKVTGIHFYKINPDWENQRNDKDVDIAYQTMKDGKPVWDHFTVARGSTPNGVLAKYMQQSTTNSLKEQQEQETSRHNKQAESAEYAKIQAGLEENAMTQGYAEPVLGDNGKVTGVKLAEETVDPFGTQLERLPRKEFMKREQTFQTNVMQKMVTPVEQSYTMFNKAYQETHDANGKYHQAATGAPGMVALSTHLSTTFGNVKGARITKDMIQHHLGARSVSDDALIAIQKLTSGEVISAKQWDAFGQLISESRASTWKLAGENANNLGLPRTFYPKPAKRDNSQVPSKSTAQLYLDAADGNADLAYKAMHTQGWK